MSTPITVARGDGIGPEIMDATLRILKEAGARLDIEEIVIGKAMYEQGHSSGIADSSWESLKRTGVFLKAPITTPQGGGFKSLNVTIRKSMGLFANVRPTVSYHPVVATKYPGIDMVIVRENEEDLYSGIEHRQTDDMYQCLKLISRPGCERIVRYAFEYARANGRKRVTALVKDNIMKMTDGIFHKVFDEVGAEYPDLVKDSLIVDIGTARIADTPERFDVVVTLNLYGDIVSDVAAQVAGSVGLAGSSNIGPKCAMFEAIHGSAPDIAGKGIANPSGLLLSAVMMLVHIGQAEVAERIQNAWLCALESGRHTGDIYREPTDTTRRSADGASRERVGTEEFANEVIRQLGNKPKIFKPVAFGAAKPMPPIVVRETAPAKKEMVGVDIWVNWRGRSMEDMEYLAGLAVKAASGGAELQMISSKGLKMWPGGQSDNVSGDHWCLRYLKKGGPISHGDIVATLNGLQGAGLDFIKLETLCTFDGQNGFSAGQGQ
jgi:isocitrate dehydrogenase